MNEGQTERNNVMIGGKMSRCERRRVEEVIISSGDERERERERVHILTFFFTS